MPGSNGELTLSYSGGVTLKFGTITGVSHTFSKTCMTMPLVSMHVEDTFALDNKTQKTVTVSFTRIQPLNPNNSSSDSDNWSNAHWLEQLEFAMNRWQCKTDGFKLRFRPATDNPYMPQIDSENTEGYNGYIRSLSVRYREGTNTELSGSFEFHVGTMYVNTEVASPSDGTVQRAYRITITDEENGNPSILLGTNDQGVEINCVDSYTLSGGLESPFEYISLVVPKNRLTSVAPGLFREDGSTRITAGLSKLYIDAVGTSTMTVTKCKLNNSRYTITAYCDAEALRGMVLERPVTATPRDLVNQILTTGDYGVRFTSDTLKMNVQSDPSWTLHFDEGQNAWYVLQVAAMCMGARVFFANNNAYVVDYRNALEDPDNETVLDYGDIDLYPDTQGNAMYASLVSSVSLGDEGMDTVMNTITIRAGQPDDVGEGEEQTYSQEDVTYSDPPSVNTFNTRDGGKLYIPELRNIPEVIDEETGELEHSAADEPQIFATNLISYRSEPQQSIEFTVKEMHSSSEGPVWIPCFIPSARASSIKSGIDDIVIDNMSDIEGRGEVKQKLCLSTFERHYPEGTTTYTWGVMSSIDLSTSTSQIVSNLGNV